MQYKLEEVEDIARCLQCGAVIDYGGRPDRKFCSNGCKNRYHNYRRFKRRDITQRSVMKILDRNYFVLDRLLTMDVNGIDRVTLAYMGFDPAFSTSFCRMGRRDVYTCYNIRYELTTTRIKNISYIEGLEGPTSEQAP